MLKVEICIILLVLIVLLLVCVVWLGYKVLLKHKYAPVVIV